MENRTIEVSFVDGRKAGCTIWISKVPPWRIFFSGAGIDNKEYLGRDLFQALTLLRRELEQQGARLLCAGSRPDVYPSGMSRDMGGGRNAYVTRLGSPARDLVDIFDPADVTAVGSVADQENFRDRWVESIEAIAEDLKHPRPEEIEEARRNPGGWVYRIAGQFSPDQDIPPEAIIGAWKVDRKGNIVGELQRNDRYDPARWPAS